MTPVSKIYLDLEDNTTSTIFNISLTLDRLFPGYSIGEEMDSSCTWITEYIPKYWNYKLVSK